jgi:hypothetical protein
MIEYIIPSWLAICILVYIYKKPSIKGERLRVMSCRKNFKTFRRLDEADKQSLF